jgi:hypothetical protein
MAQISASRSPVDTLGEFTVGIIFPFVNKNNQVMG